MPSSRASHCGRRAVWGSMLRRTLLITGVLAGLLLAGCRTSTSRTSAHKEAVRTNAISNKHVLTEEPTLERPQPRVAPAPDSAVH